MEDVVEPELRSHRFSAKTAYYMARASRCAYEEPGEWIEKLGLHEKITFFDCGQFRGFVAMLDHAALLAFRGTQSIGNCLTDADTLLVPHSPYPGRVHCGFAEAVDEVWPQVRQLLGTPSPTRALWLTGHSLGAAMATLASVRLAHEGYKVRAVYTYGSPRPGDRVFHDSYCLPNYRFVNNNDLVPHLPFRWCYKHVGKLKLVDDGELDEAEASWEAKKRSLSGKAKHVQRAHRHANGLLQAICDFDWLADHHLDKYLDAIKRLLPRIPHRSPLERILTNAHGVPAPRLRLHSPLPAVPPPHRDRGSRNSPVISEADLIAAFSDQPRGVPSVVESRLSAA
jgi:triacylglycerol lipase